MIIRDNGLLFWATL